MRRGPIDKSVMNVPNLLTLVRLVSLPVTIVLFTHGNGFAAAAVFVAAMLTDCLDGWLAKRLGQCTSLGLYLDPVVDKIVILSLFYQLAHARVIDWPVPHLFLARELLQNAVRAVAAGQRGMVGANWMGKTKATLQTVLIAWGLSMPDLSLKLSNTVSCHLQRALDSSTWTVLCLTWCFFAVFVYRNRRFLRTGSGDFDS